MSNINVVLDNLLFSLQKMGGGSLYWKAITESVASDADFNVKYIERHDASSNTIRQKMDLPIFDNKEKDRNLRLDELSSVPIEGRTLFHSSFFRYGVGDECANITTVHDFICMYQYSGLLKFFSFWQIKRAVLHSQAIICISDSTKRDLLRFIPEAKSLPIEVIPQGIDEAYSYAKRERSNQVVFIGNRSVGYKNFKKTIESVSLVKGMKLIVIGAPLTKAEVKMLDAYLPDRYQSEVFPSSEKVSHIFNESMALLYLSEYEGFGLPPLEAMKSGLPVIALNKSSIPEVVGDSAILLESADPREVALRLQRLSEDSSLFNHYVEKGAARASLYSWDKTAQRTKDFYRKVWEFDF